MLTRFIPPGNTPYGDMPLCGGISLGEYLVKIPPLEIPPTETYMGGVFPRETTLSWKYPTVIRGVSQGEYHVTYCTYVI